MTISSAVTKNFRSSHQQLTVASDDVSRAVRRQIAKTERTTTRTPHAHMTHETSHSEDLILETMTACDRNVRQCSKQPSINAIARNA